MRGASRTGKPEVPPAGRASETSEEIVERILVAAQAEFELIGIRRANMQDIARRAGIARATVYRRYPGKETLVQAVAERELIAVMSRVASAVAFSADAADAVVQLSVASARELRSNALLTRVMETEPLDVYEYAASNGGTALAIARTFVVRFLNMLQGHGLSSEDDLAIAVEIMIRLAATQLLITDGLIPFDNDEEVAAFARRFLVPLITVPAPE